MGSTDVFRYFREQLASGLFCALTPEMSELLTRARDALLEGLLALDRLDRGDPIWTQSDGHLRLELLEPYVARWLAQEPASADALWCGVGLALHKYDRSFGCEHWPALKAARPETFEVRWPILAACFVAAATDVDTAPALAELIRALGLEGEAAAYLAEDHGLGGGAEEPTDRAWSERVLEGLRR